MNRAFWAVLFDSKNPFRIWLPPSVRVRPLIFLIALRGGIRKIGGFDSRPSFDRKSHSIAKIGQIFGWLASYSYADWGTTTKGVDSNAA